MKLGKRQAAFDRRTLMLARYMTAALPAPPSSVDWSHGITDFGMMCNDRLGCCTIGAVGHAVQTWTVNALGRETTVPDSTILEYYEKWDGYNPADPSTDQGGVELDVLNDWRQQEFSGVSLDAYVAVELGTRDSGQGASEPEAPLPIAQAIWLFGGAYIGIELPIRAQKQDVWDVPANPGPEDEPGSWGGHAVYLVGYDLPVAPPVAPPVAQALLPVDGAAQPAAPTNGRTQPGVAVLPTLTCITWGAPKKMTLAWFEKYCSEAYALVSKDWLAATGLSPSGFDLAALEADLKEVTSGV
jgi:hypothetical protein